MPLAFTQEDFLVRFACRKGFIRTSTIPSSPISVTELSAREHLCSDSHGMVMTVRILKEWRRYCFDRCLSTPSEVPTLDGGEGVGGCTYLGQGVQTFDGGTYLGQGYLPCIGGVPTLLGCTYLGQGY